MTRTALSLAPSPAPCVSNPALWDSIDNKQAIDACRRLCPRRFACAQEALDQPRLQGVVAGVSIPEQNAYGTCKSHKAALGRLQAVAAQGQRLGMTGAARAS